MKQAKVKKVLIALLLVSVTHMALGSFTGRSEKRVNDLYSLKNFNKNLYKSASIFSLRAGFEYKGTRFLSQKKEVNGDITMYSMMRYAKGNTTYIYPYALKIVIPKFKTPTPPAFH